MQSPVVRHLFRRRSLDLCGSPYHRRLPSYRRRRRPSIDPFPVIMIIAEMTAVPSLRRPSPRSIRKGRGPFRAPTDVLGSRPPSHRPSQAARTRRSPPGPLAPTRWPRRRPLNPTRASLPFPPFVPIRRCPLAPPQPRASPDQNGLRCLPLRRLLLLPRCVTIRPRHRPLRCRHRVVSCSPYRFASLNLPSCRFVSSRSDGARPLVQRPRSRSGCHHRPWPGSRLHRLRLDSLRTCRCRDCPRRQWPGHPVRPSPSVRVRLSASGRAPLPGRSVASANVSPIEPARR